MHRSSNGYLVESRPGNARATPRTGLVFVHLLIAERILGKPLRRSAEVHHVDEDKTNNAHQNLVLCDSRAYHALLHQRQRALEACGDPSALRCLVCGRYDRQDEMVIVIDKQGREERRRGRHRDCAARAMLKYRKKRAALKS